MILPQVYEPLFHLYVLKNESSDEQYWTRIQRLNRQDDLTLMSYLGVNSKFWFLTDGGKLDSTESVCRPLDLHYLDIHSDTVCMFVPLTM